eukprot:1353780-Amphidinium_carterae.1
MFASGYASSYECTLASGVREGATEAEVDRQAEADLRVRCTERLEGCLGEEDWSCLTQRPSVAAFTQA